MATFHTTSGISHHLENIIKGAQDRLVLISPYLQINARLKEILEDKDLFKIDIRVVCRQSELDPKEQGWLRDLSSIRVSTHSNLHAKCYLSESQALLTSMNLYEFSQNNNHEMGILATKDEDPELYGEIWDEATRLLRMSEDIPATPRPKPSDSSPSPRAKRLRSQSGQGHCIRCGEAIALNRKIPLCKGCYRRWKKFRNRHYKEKFCHKCGKENQTSLAAPCCDNCS